MSVIIVTSKSKKKVIATADYKEISDFVIQNQDAKFRTVDYTGKTKILSRQSFLARYLKNNSKEKETFFALVEILIPYYHNLRYFLSQHDLKEEYDKFKKTI